MSEQMAIFMYLAWALAGVYDVSDFSLQVAIRPQGGSGDLR
jgi:hypothetical protein